MGCEINQIADEKLKAYEKYFTSEERPIFDTDLMVREGTHRVIVKSQEVESDSEIYDVNTSIIRKGYEVKGAMLTIEENNSAHDKNGTMVEKMVAEVVHEIKNPLFSIRGYAQLLDKSLTEDDNRKKYTTIMLNEIDRLQGMTETFLFLSRQKAKKLKRLNINETVEEVVSLYSERMEKIKFEKQKSEENYVNGDKDQLKQVFINLFENALDAVGDSGQLSLRIYSTHDKVIIELKDNGPGIKKDDESRVFNPFFTTKKMGTGLGLYISKKIVEDHRGSIYFISEEGKGTTFFVELPLAK